MTQVVTAIYEDGVLRQLERLQLNEREEVRVTVESLARSAESGKNGDSSDPLAGLRVSKGIPDLAERFDEYRLGR